jgi:hypothetical protein
VTPVRRALHSHSQPHTASSSATCAASTGSCRHELWCSGSRTCSAPQSQRGVSNSSELNYVSTCLQTLCF